MNKLVSAITVNSEILREEGEVVRLPFGTEYSIYLKNLNHNQRCVLNITIDGSPITGSGLVLDAGKSATLERPINDQRRFKFIERTPGIENYRGVNPEDGLIVIKFQYEVQNYNPPFIKYIDDYDILDNHKGISPRGFSSRSVTKGIFNQAYNTSVSSSVDYNISSQNQVGITGHGSVSNQVFSNTMVNTLETNVNTIVFRLQGYVYQKELKEIKKPINISTKKICSLCGRRFNSNVLYCPDDGNSLDFESSIF